MKNKTRQQFNDWKQGQLDASGAVESGNGALQFTASASVAQTVVNKMQDSADLLRRINVVEVDAQQADKLGLGASSPIASTGTNATGRRDPHSVFTLDENGYRCEQVNTDTFISFDQLDAWSGLDDFAGRIDSQIITRQALDRIMIGFHGITHTARSNIEKNPLLQDVNTGWLQHYREHSPQRVISGVSVSRRNRDNVIESSGDYGTVDSLILDAYKAVLDPWFVDSEDLVVICGRSLLSQKYFPLVNGLGNVATPTKELLSWLMLAENQTLGGLPAYEVPFFPDNAALVTTFENLSFYWQTGTDRRRVEDESIYNRIAVYDSRNEAYVVEDYGSGCLLENIVWGSDGKSE
ncbi:phage major capsid protein, P2 family [Rahnella sp. ChDrAdgB13]|uniref:phage major capsid protein, P2 family n=1 Tax=Rahnella sp. ChDrAdgB13 TaxID=1850581 RepID=UPI001AD884A2|nr:phage major capsid protein, P2 family [Rahnella sp. ChDrAdgB13]